MPNYAFFLPAYDDTTAHFSGSWQRPRTPLADSVASRGTLHSHILRRQARSFDFCFVTEWSFMRLTLHQFFPLLSLRRSTPHLFFFFVRLGSCETHCDQPEEIDEALGVVRCQSL
ncbi:hypothetical protein OE88DRAFT_24849 [Heliocybe sulcata]|uniref:Uncharacterized protein n=1 Tax=Heliocybe sulcata TaxID=5364 RepID=A0A5C3NRZ5_9AGAM|nr:hypothetical protein OE88DRAFT_24849 [Heliocybe sulcata]